MFACIRYSGFSTTCPLSQFMEKVWKLIPGKVMSLCLMASRCHATFKKWSANVLFLITCDSKIEANHARRFQDTRDQSFRFFLRLFFFVFSHKSQNWL